MPNYRRPKQAGASVFLTVNLADRSSNMLVQDIAALRDAVTKTRSERPFKIDAWVVLPDHMHCVWTLPEGDADFSTRMGAIKARFSMNVRRAGFTPPRVPISARGLQVMANGEVNPALRKGQVGIWQKRFWEHHIRDEADFAAHVNYCWINPVKHGLAATPADWPYSSYHREDPQSPGP